MAAHSAALISTEELARRMDAPALRLFDCTTYLRPRPEGGYNVESGRANYDKGHIPGAANRFFQLNLDSGGKFRPAAALRQEFAALLGDTAPESVTHYCGSGVTACHNLLAMEVAGLAGSRLFPGSWSEWCSDPSRPVATGEA